MTTTADPKVQNQRRGVRVNSRVPVELEWNDATGHSIHSHAQTRVVNAYGCLLVSADVLELDQQLSVKNLATHSANPAVVVWKGKERAEGWEFGVELVNPKMDFWGLDW